MHKLCTRMQCYIQPRGLETHMYILLMLLVDLVCLKVNLCTGIQVIDPELDPGQKSFFSRSFIPFLQTSVYTMYTYTCSYTKYKNRKNVHMYMHYIPVHSSTWGTRVISDLSQLSCLDCVYINSYMYTYVHVLCNLFEHNCSKCS